ncbi:hypothetical protein Tco_1091386 [Tanacetum coccineum]|uniref:Uncharacterized protein n=1 Tax=Tanacetum coccineum TaxID=301880 RepID=A0ABQ5I6W6_9ASTR
MVSFRQLHSHLKLLSNNDLKGTQTESGFKRAFATLFGQDIKTFTGTMFLYVDQLEKQLDKEEFQEIGSMASFKVLETQFQMFIKSRMYMDDEYVVMTRNYFLQYTQLEIPEFYNKGLDTCKALDASLVDTESSGTELKRRIQAADQGMMHIPMMKISNPYTDDEDIEYDYMLKTIIHAQTIQKRLDDKKLQIQECTVQEVKASNAISEDKAQECCMVSFRLLHSHLKLLSNNDLKGARTEYGFKRAFATLFSQDLETFTGTMFLNMDQLEKQLDKEEFQEIGSITTFKVLETQFQMFIKSRIYLDDEYVVMTRNYFLQYTQLEIPEFCDTLIQHMESVKKSIDERALHKREYDTRVNERQMLTTEEKVDSSKAFDVSLVDIEKPMAEVQSTAEINIFATGQQHTEQPEFNNEGEVDQNAEQFHDTCPLPAKLTDNQTTELSNQSLESENICLKKTVA